MIQFISDNQAEIIGITIFVLAALYAAVLTGKIGSRPQKRPASNGTEKRPAGSSLNVYKRVAKDL